MSQETKAAKVVSPDTYTLKYPYKTASGVMVESLKLRRPKVGDLKLAQRLGNEAEQELALLVAVSEPKLVPEDLEEMDLADYQGLVALFRDGLDS